MSSVAEVAYALEDALIQLITNATAAGGMLNGPSQYAPFKIVERVTPPEQRLFPSVSAQFRRLDETPIGTHRSDVTATYDLAVAVNAEYAAGQPGTIASARAKLRPFIFDGAGNGIVALLRSQPTLGALCRRSKIISMEEVALVSGSSTASSVVAALIVFECEYAVSI